MEWVDRLCFHVGCSLEYKFPFAEYPDLAMTDVFIAALKELWVLNGKRGDGITVASTVKGMHMYYKDSENPLHIRCHYSNDNDDDLDFTCYNDFEFVNKFCDDLAPHGTINHSPQ